MEKKTEYWNSWWYIGIWIVAIYFIFPAVNNFVKSNDNKARQAKQAEVLKNRLKNNMSKLSIEENQQLTDFAAQVYVIEMNSLSGEDKADYVRLRGAGDKLTIDEGIRLTVLIQKSKNGMSREDKKFVEEFEHQTKAMLT